ncbi:MAG: protein kinase domain-containing protein [Thermoguttaceae bacterium]
MSQQDADTRPGEQQAPPEVPDFDLIRPVGRGGFGEVWLATNRTTGQLRAVKIIPLRQAGEVDPAAREITSLTRLEARLARQHPNLITIHHVGKTADYLFYVMDPADDAGGGPASNKPDYRPATLQSRLQTAPLSAEVCRDYAGQLLAGLASLHAAGMVHRDVKPANCLFVDGQLKLADFGLVTEVHPLVSRVGTQKYMPPDGRMDMRADVFAAGLVIYEIISGLPVDDFPRLGRQANCVRNNPILVILLQLVLHACERAPERRPVDARAMLTELAMSSRTAHRSPRWRLPTAICAAAVFAVGVLAAWTLAPPHGDLCDVSFVTEPFEAKIYLDGVVQRDPEGNAYTTPCTVYNLRARTWRVAFEWAGSHAGMPAHTTWHGRSRL